MANNEYREPQQASDTVDLVGALRESVAAARERRLAEAASRAEMDERREHGLKARHETRQERAIRRQVAEEIAEALEGLAGHASPLACASVARLVGSLDAGDYDHGVREIGSKGGDQ